MNALSQQVKRFGSVLLVMAALSVSPEKAFGFDDDVFENRGGGLDSLCFCDGGFRPDEDGIIKFPAGLPGCPCVWWHTHSKKGMCGPCDFTCPNRRVNNEVSTGAPSAKADGLME
jgi:hypothetical protein